MLQKFEQAKHKAHHLCSSIPAPDSTSQPLNHSSSTSLQAVNKAIQDHTNLKKQVKHLKEITTNLQRQIMQRDSVIMEQQNHLKQLKFQISCKNSQSFQLSKVFERKIASLEDDNKALAQNIAIHQTQHKDLVRDSHDLSLKMGLLKEQNIRMKERMIGLDRELQRITQQNVSLKMANQLLEERNKTLDQGTKNMQCEISRLNNTHQMMLNRPDSSHHQRADHEKAISQKAQELRTLQSQMQQVKAKYKEKKQKMKEHLEELKKNSYGKEEALAKADLQRDRLQALIFSLQSQLSQLKGSVLTYSNQLLSARQYITQQNSILQKQACTIDSLSQLKHLNEKSIEQIKEKSHHLQFELTALESALAGAKEKCNQLEMQSNISNDTINRLKEVAAACEHKLIRAENDCEAYKKLLQEAGQRQREKQIQLIKGAQGEASKVNKLRSLDQIKNLIVTHKYAHRTSR